jgi:hypothetical protein
MEQAEGQYEELFYSSYPKAAGSAHRNANDPPPGGGPEGGSAQHTREAGVTGRNQKRQTRSSVRRLSMTLFSSLVSGIS